LTQAERTKLLGVLGMLGSDHDGERAAAGLLAVKLLRERGLGWDDVLAPPPPAPDDRSWKQDAIEAGRSPGLLTEWERGFIRNLLHGERISAKQRITLDAIMRKVRGA